MIISILVSSAIITYSYHPCDTFYGKKLLWDPRPTFVSLLAKSALSNKILCAKALLIKLAKKFSKKIGIAKTSEFGLILSKNNREIKVNQLFGRLNTKMLENFCYEKNWKKIKEKKNFVNFHQKADLLFVSIT